MNTNAFISSINQTKDKSLTMKISVNLRFASENILKNYLLIFSKKNLQKFETNLFKFDLKFLMECKQKGSNSLDFIQNLCDQNGQIIDYVNELWVNFLQQHIF